MRCSRKVEAVVVAVMAVVSSLMIFDVNNSYIESALRLF